MVCDVLHDNRAMREPALAHAMRAGPHQPVDDAWHFSRELPTAGDDALR